MPKRIFVTFLFFLLCIFTYGQNKTIPKNLKQAVMVLQKDCPDSLKILIKKTPDDKLITLIRPWGGEYHIISDWFDDRNEFIKIGSYLSKRGIKYTPHKEEIILITFKKDLLGLPFEEEVILKPYQKTERKWAIEDKVRYTIDSLRGNYIPKDLQDCFKQIDKLWSDSIKTVVKSWSEDKFSGNAHRGFGMWMRNNWALWAGSRLSKYFNEMGIYHPESMSGIILSSYHRYLSGKAIRLQEQLDEDKGYWIKSKQREIKRKEEAFVEYNIGDTVNYLYPHNYISDKQEELYDNDGCIARGIVIEKNNKLFLLKITILETCDKKGIVIYSNKNAYIYEHKKLVRIRKPTIRVAKKNTSLWFEYDAWETKN